MVVRSVLLELQFKKSLGLYRRFNFYRCNRYRQTWNQLCTLNQPTFKAYKLLIHFLHIIFIVLRGLLSWVYVCVCVDLDWIGSNKLCFFWCAHFRLNSKNWNKKKQGSNNSSGKQADYVELLYWRYCGIAIKNQKRKEIAVWVDSFTSHRFHVDAFSKLTQLWDSRAGAFATLCNWHESKSHAINISIIFFRV